MKLTEEIKLLRPHYGPVGSQGVRYSISDRPIEEFIDNLLGEGIKIDLDKSVMDVRYDLKTCQQLQTERNTTVPLGTQFPQEVHIDAFYLRDGESLELMLKDYDHTTSHSRKGVIGGYATRTTGIICNLTLEGKTVDPSVVDKVTKALRETYDPISSYPDRVAGALLKKQLDNGGTIEIPSLGVTIKKE